MFATFARLLHPRGILMFTSGSEQGETWSDNGGQMLYHASLDSAAYRRLLEEHGFRVMRHAADDAACGGATVWTAQLRQAGAFIQERPCDLDAITTLPN